MNDIVLQHTLISMQTCNGQTGQHTKIKEHYTYHNQKVINIFKQYPMLKGIKGVKCLKWNPWIEIKLKFETCMSVQY